MNGYRSIIGLSVAIASATYWGPSQARFLLEADPVGYEDDLNLYVYAGNDPLDKTDPTGKDAYIVGRPVESPALAAQMAFAAAIASGHPENAPLAAAAAFNAVAETKHSFLVVTPGHATLGQGQIETRYSYGPSGSNPITDPGTTALQGPKSPTSQGDIAVLKDLASGVTDPGVSFSKISGIDNKTAEAIFGAKDQLLPYSLVPELTPNTTNSNAEAFARGQAAANRAGTPFVAPQGTYPGSGAASRVSCPSSSGQDLCK